MSITLGEIARYLGLELRGDDALVVDGIAPLASAQGKQISFLSNPRFSKELSQTRAAAVILKPEFAAECRTAVLVSDNPYLSFARLTALFDDAPRAKPGIAASALVDPSVHLGNGVSIGPNVVIGANAVIGDNTIIGANSVVGDHCRIGSGCHLHANVTLYHRVRMGDEVTIHSGTVIGADGFGFAPRGKGQGWEKIHQLGGVVIGNRVDIGANSCIDRGALDDTVIGNGVIIDNQVQIAHNCIIGDNTAIAGCVGIAGSTVIGKNCTLAGGVGVAGHLEIVDGVHVTSMSLVTGSITQSGSYSSGTAMMDTRQWRKSAVLFSHLEELQQRLRTLEKKLSGSSPIDG